MTNETDEILLRQAGGLGRITLNRPSALNALTPGMLRAMHWALDQWEDDPAVRGILIEGAGDRGFCAGGDLRLLHASGLRRDGVADRFWHDEYVLDARIARSTKPVVGIMTGLVIGGGVGLTAHARHRVVTDGTRLSMPEVRIGLIPDVGATWLLSRTPGESGTYLALTGASIGPGDALALGLADYFVPETCLDDMVEKIAHAPDEIASILRAADQPAPPAHLTARLETIDACFAHDHVAEIVEALREEGSDWSREARTAMELGSPTSLALTLAALRAAPMLGSLEDCLGMEYCIVRRILEGPDFYEGVRAVILDKDRNPRWQPARLDDVSAETIQMHLAPVGEWTLDFGRLLSAPGRDRPTHLV